MFPIRKRGFKDLNFLCLFLLLAPAKYVRRFFFNLLEFGVLFWALKSVNNSPE